MISVEKIKHFDGQSPVCGLSITNIIYKHEIFEYINEEGLL